MIRLFIFIILQFACNCYAVVDHPQEVIVHQTIANYMQQYHVPGVAVELYIDGKPYSYYFGYANREKKNPVTGQTIFEVGSISKVMTSLLLAQEIDAAKMQLDDSITKFIQTLPATYEDITLKNLATHTSGLPFNPPASVTTQVAFSKYLQEWKPQYEADSEWIYSNVGMNMLGYSIEAATRKNFNQLYLKKIAKPLGMQPLGLTVPRSYQKYYAQGYDQNAQPIKPFQIKLSSFAGGIKASAQDMQRFLSAAIGLPGTPERIFYPMRMTQAAYVELPDKMQGLGWEVNAITRDNIADLIENPKIIVLKAMEVVEIFDQPVFDGNLLIDKTGATEGFRSYIALIPNKKSGIVILTNKRAADSTIIKVGREILFKLTKVSTQRLEEENRIENSS